MRGLPVGSGYPSAPSCKPGSDESPAVTLRRAHTGTEGAPPAPDAACHLSVPLEAPDGVVQRALGQSRVIGLEFVEGAG